MPTPSKTLFKKKSTKNTRRATKLNTKQNKAAMMQHCKKTVWSFYKKNRRDFPWRRDTSLYSIIVSEIMLQQTQAPRVVPKYLSFMKRFPDFASLAGAPLRDVLSEWKGLGYNRRALQLKKTAELIIAKSENGSTSWNKESLMALPGLGPNTAGSILAFAFNIPQAFIETNIRTVFIHFFFPETRAGTSAKNKKKIDDKQILPLVEASLRGSGSGSNSQKAREWFYALMDYGVHLKKTGENPSRRSLHHVKQSPFKGSNRELRAKILADIVASPQSLSTLIKKMKKGISSMDLNNYISITSIDEKIAKNISDLEREGFIIRKNNVYHIV